MTLNLCFCYQMEASLSASTPFKVSVNGCLSSPSSSTSSKDMHSSFFGQSLAPCTEKLNDHSKQRAFAAAVWKLIRCLLSPCAFRCSLVRTQWSHLNVPTKHDIQRIVLSAVPYLLFLFFYGINPYIHVLPLSSDIGCANLRNVSAWESYFFPWPIHLMVSSMHFILLDFLAAVPYLAHYAIPVLYPVFLYLIDRLELVQQFYRMLGLTMWGHYAIWLVLPTLPPWALDFMAVGQKTGANQTALAQAILVAHKEGSAFARIDSFTGRLFFYGMFVGNPVPFGSFPSGHVAWPMCILLTLPVNLRQRFSVYVVWVAWATLYTGHHYVLDIGGAIVLVAAIARLVGYATLAQSRCPVLPL